MRDGTATLEQPQTRRWLAGPDWTGATVAIMASGPSMSASVAASVREWRQRDAGRRAIVTNTTFRLAPWADVLYACDTIWWDGHVAEVRDTFGGALWTTEFEAKARHGINQIGSSRGDGLGRKPGVIHQGMNSGYQAINFAWQCGATRMILLGFDMHDAGGRAHWHADHPPRIRRANPYAAWLDKFPALASDLLADGCTVLNCTPGSALRAFPAATLHEALL